MYHGIASSDIALDALLRLALDAAFDSVIIHRPDGTLLYWNEVAARDAGFPTTDVAPVPPWGFTPAPHAVRQKRLEEIERNGFSRFSSSTVEYDGSKHVIEVSARWFTTDQGPVIISIARDVTEQAEAEAALREMALHDSLTGLANRNMLEERMKAAVSSAERHGDILGLMFIDIDDFKPVNDSYGHDVGDSVLCALARRLEAGVRTEDTVARVGGDEFVIVLPRLMRPDDLSVAAHKVLAMIREPIDVEGETISVDATIGHALFDNGHDDSHGLMIRADLAMYQGRRAGIHINGAETIR